MRSSLGFLIVAIVWSGCGRLGLDAPIEPGSGAAGDGAGGTTGGSGSGGASGTAGTGPTGTGGRVGSPGTAGTSAAGAGGGGTGGTDATGAGGTGVAGIGGTVGTGGTGVAGTGGRGGTTGTGGTGVAGTGGRGGTGGTGVAGTGGRGGTVGTGGTGVAGTGGRGGSMGTAGTGGVMGTGGTGGTGVMTCVPGRSEACTCATGAQGAQVCRADGTFDRCVCASSEFQRIRDGMVGTWMGKQSNPWTPPYQVRLTFGSDGHYSGHCAQASCPEPVFYYGSDDDTPLKIYNLVDLHQDGTAYGRIALYFSPGGVNSEVIDEVFVTLDKQHLTFQFWNGDYGPLVFDLARVMN